MATYDVLHFGAIPDGTVLNTRSLQNALDACERKGGGRVLIPAGRYLTGALNLHSNIDLHLEQGATLLFSENPDDYPTVSTRWGGLECHAYSPCLYSSHAENVSLSGGGVIDGQGQRWWRRYFDLHQEKSIPNDREILFGELNEDAGLRVGDSPYTEWRLQHLRPALVQFFNCRRVRLEGLLLQNSPFWNTHIVYCDNVTIQGVTFQNPSGAPNGDGLDIDSSTNIRVSDCHFDVNDDCLCLKSGIDEDGRRVNRPTENVVVTNCTMLRGHGGVVFGSEIAGGIRNVCVSNCIFIGTDRGIRFKANRARGGFVEDISISNIIMKDVQCPFVINSHYVCGHDPEDEILFGDAPQPVTEKTPSFRNISVYNFTARGVTCAAAYISGLPESPVTGLRFDNVEIETTMDPCAEAREVDAIPRVNNRHLRTAEGFSARFTEGLFLRGVRVNSRQSPALLIEDSTNVAVQEFRTHLQPADEERISLPKVGSLSIPPSK